MYSDELKLRSIIDMFLNCEVPHVYTIFMSNCNDKKRIDKFVLEEFKNKPIRISQSNGGTYLTAFNENGAMFKIVVMNYHSRGFRNFLSLYEDKCPEDFLESIIQPTSHFYMNFNINNISGGESYDRGEN